MNIILGKDGKLSVNESPLQGKEAETLENVLALIENPSDGDAIVYDADAGIWKAGEVSGGGGSSGGGANILEVGYTADYGNGGTTTYTLDKTAKQIYDAAASGFVYLKTHHGGEGSGVSDEGYQYSRLIEVYVENGAYVINAIIDGNDIWSDDFGANDYPVLTYST